MELLILLEMYEIFVKIVFQQLESNIFYVSFGQDNVKNQHRDSIIISVPVTRTTRFFSCCWC